MARPTKAQQEEKRRALMGESEAEIISETKNTAEPLDKGDFSVNQLETELEDVTLGRGGKNNASSQDKSIEQGDFTQPDIDDPHYVPTQGHDRFKEPMIENESDANRAATGKTNTTSNDGPKVTTQTDFAEPEINGSAPHQDQTEDAKKKKEEPLHPNFDDLSPTQKREQVEMFADTILTTYAQILPVIPTMLCSFNMNKMELLDRDGVLRLSMVIQKSEGGSLTVREQFNSFNEEVSTVFVVTPEMKAELRDPLIAVLMERGIAPTPMTTLLVTIGRHILMFAVATYQMIGTRNAQLEEFKQFRKEELEIERERHKKDQNRSATDNKKSEVKTEKTETESSGSGISMEDALSNSSETKERESVVKITSNNQPGITIDEVVPE